MEGDSAKSFAVAFLAQIGQDKHGILPLHGNNFVNVRRATDDRIMKNESVKNIMEVMGLTFDKVYTDVNSLRYGSILIMADADHDGSHLKGLIINFFLFFWPSLLQLEGFLQQFVTPIMKVTKELECWLFYKGLAAITDTEATMLFGNGNTNNHLPFRWDAK